MAVHFGVLTDSGYLMKGLKPRTQIVFTIVFSYNPVSILESYLLKSDNKYAFFYAIVPGNGAGAQIEDKMHLVREI